MTTKQSLAPDKPKAIICDLDGTLALLGSRNPHATHLALEDALNHPVANLIEVYAHQDKFDVRLILLTGREERYRDITVDWLRKYDITHYQALYMRPIGDRRKDYIIKRDIYQQEIQRSFNVLFVLEDRDQVVRMWRRMGLDCFQVAYGDF